MFVAKYHPKVVQFRDLPMACKLAVIWYKAVDTAAYPQSDYIKAALGHGAGMMKKAVRSSVGFYDCEVRQVEWGIATVPLAAFMVNISDAIRGPFEEFHQSYCKINRLDELPSRDRWPLVINPQTGAIVDGCHRFHSYINQGAKAVRCVWMNNSCRTSGCVD